VLESTPRSPSVVSAPALCLISVRFHEIFGLARNEFLGDFAGLRLDDKKALDDPQPPSVRLERRARRTGPGENITANLQFAAKRRQSSNRRR